MKLSKVFNWFTPSLGSFRINGLVFNAPFIPVVNVYRATKEDLLVDCYTDFYNALPTIKPYFRDEARFDSTRAAMKDKATRPTLIPVMPIYPPATKATRMPSYQDKLSKTVFHDSKDAARQPYFPSGRINLAKNTIRINDELSEAQTKALATRLYLDYFVSKYNPEHENIRALPVQTEADAPITYDEALHELTDICLQGQKNRSARFEHRWQTAPFEKGNRGVTLENITSAVRTGSILFALGSQTDVWPWDNGYALPAAVWLSTFAVPGIAKLAWHRNKVLKQKRPEHKFKL